MVAQYYIFTEILLTLWTDMINRMNLKGIIWSKKEVSFNGCLLNGAAYLTLKLELVVWPETLPALEVEERHSKLKTSLSYRADSSQP